MIPIFLIIYGVILIAIIMMQLIKKNMGETTLFYKCAAGVLSIAKLGWFIAGNFWVYG